MRIQDVRKLPSRAHVRFRGWTLLPFVLMTAAAGLSLTRLAVNGTVEVNLPPGDPAAVAERESASHFLQNDFVMVSVDMDPSAPGAGLAGVAALSRALAGLPGVDRVLSVSTVSDLDAAGGGLSFVKLVPDAAGPRQARDILEKVRQTPVFRDYLLSLDGHALAIYVFPSRGVGTKALLPRVGSACAFAGGGHVLATSSVEAFVERTVISDLMRIGSLVLAVILLFELGMTRSLLRALALWLMTLLPALWTLGLFPPLGLALGVQTMLIPVIVMALSTAYGVQFYRYLSLGESRSMAGALDVTTPIIVGAGATTMLGFLALLASPFTDQRIMGAMVVCGIAMAMAAALFALPVLFSGAPVPRIRPFRATETLQAISRKRFILPVYLGVMAALAVGLFLVHSDYRLSRILSPRTDLARTIAYFDLTYGGINEVQLTVDTGREAGLVDPAVYGGIQSLRQDLLASPAVSHVLGYSELVDWVRGKLAAGSGPAPATEATIGESLELLGYGSSGWGIGSLVDPTYRWARMAIRFRADAGTPRQAQAVLSDLASRIDRAMGKFLPGMPFSVTGAPLVAQRSTALLARGEITGAALYFGLLFLFILGAFRSWRWALFALLPPLAGMLFYLGMLGWWRVPLNTVSSTAIAVILGVGIDDVLCLIIYYRHQRSKKGDPLREALRMSGAAILQSTSIIVLAVLALLVSRYTSFTQVSLLAGSSFLFCASVTLLVIPHLIRRSGGRLS